MQQILQMNNSKNLVKIGNRNIGGETTDVVDARELHTSLGIKTLFKDWIARRIEQYSFEEGIDYEKVLLKNEQNPQGGRPTTEYNITVDMAKELSMVENNDKGRLIRRFFIEVEKERRHNLAAIPDPEDVLRREIYGLMEKVGEKTRIYDSFAAMGVSQSYIKYWLDGKKPLTPEKLAKVRRRVDYLRRLYGIGFDLDSNLVMSFETYRPDELRELVLNEQQRPGIVRPLTDLLDILYGICLDMERLMYYDFTIKHESL